MYLKKPMMGKNMLQYFLYKLLMMVALLLLIEADPTGFINIDCGLAPNSSYVDSHTGLTYVSDESYVTTGIIKNTARYYSTNLISQQLASARSFPNGTRNCYNVSLIQGNKYLVRATFYYGNYDELNTLPVFDVYIGSSKWATVQLDDIHLVTYEEILHIPSLNYTYICIINVGTGIPFISALEVRPININAYVTPTNISLALWSRLDVGSLNNETIRFPDDVYDRRWKPYYFDQWIDISTGETIDAKAHNDYQPPSIVMRSACIPTNASKPLAIHIDLPDPTFDFYVYMHFAEVQKLQPNQSRHFNVLLNGNLYSDQTITPNYLNTYTFYSKSAMTGGTYKFIIIAVEGSTLPPLLNAYESYYVVNNTLLTYREDVYAIVSIKSAYRITKNWQGDPCTPQVYIWEGLSCSYNDNTPPVIKSLNLSSSQLEGQIALDIANLVHLETLDLSNNSLIGPVPSFLSELQSLKVLNLAGNNLTGTIPASLFARSENNSLSLSVSGNPNLCQSIACSKDKKSKSKVIPAVVVIVVLIVLGATLAVIWWKVKRNRREAGKMETNMPLEVKNRQLTYSEILMITNNFERVLGEGGFGIVYYGELGGTPVAVKMLSPSSTQGYKEFQTEVKLLMRVHHKNLTGLVGYCHVGTNLGLIYEYMANGNLKHHLSEKNPNVLSWERRLNIALEAAQGLEYLHNGCKPQILHRDIKTTNILLDQGFHAKLADFGISKDFQTTSGTHVLTTVAGTPGYLDPECYNNNRLSEKSDVYSFGVVLLEIITGRLVISKAPDRTHISVWVGSMLECGDIKSIVDPRLREDFDINSAWKIVEVAMACASTTSSKRPSMTQVVFELNEILAAKVAQTLNSMSIESTDSSDLMSAYMHTRFSPSIR